VIPVLVTGLVIGLTHEDSQMVSIPISDKWQSTPEEFFFKINLF